MVDSFASFNICISSLRVTQYKYCYLTEYKDLKFFKIFWDHTFAVIVQSCLFGCIYSYMPLRQVIKLLSVGYQEGKKFLHPSLRTKGFLIISKRKILKCFL